MTPDQAYAIAFPIVWRLENGGDAIAVSDDPRDPGGYTRGGVALGRHPELTRPLLDEMTLADFGTFYRRNYWADHACDSLPWPLSLIVFDGAVNQGGEGAKALQAALGLAQDGDIGPATLAAVARHDPVTLAALTLTAREAAYRANAQFQTFGKGWINRIFTVALQSGTRAG